MEGELNWEAEYKRVKQELDIVKPLLTAALRHVAEEPDHSNPYEGAIAPFESGWPAILRLATPSERVVIIRNALKKVDVHGMWTGFTGKPGKRAARPRLLFTTSLLQKQQEEGLRKKRPVVGMTGGRTRRGVPKNGYARAQTTFYVSHLVLLDAGKYPTAEGDHASHLCHEPKCCNSNHLVWESAVRNDRRQKICYRMKVCRCGLQPPCDFTLHNNK